MGQILHGSARTTAAVRRAIHQSQDSLIMLASRYGINPKTVAKGKRRTSVQISPPVLRRPRPPRSRGRKQPSLSPSTFSSGRTR